MIRMTFTDAGDEQLVIHGGFYAPRDWFDRGPEPAPRVNLLGWISHNTSGYHTVGALRRALYSHGEPHSEGRLGTWTAGPTTFFKLEVDDTIVYQRAAISRLDLEPSNTVPDLIYVKLTVDHVLETLCESNFGAAAIACLVSEVGETGLSRETFDALSKWIVSVEQRLSKAAGK